MPTPTRQTTLLEKLTTSYNTFALPLCLESLRLLPDSIVLGTIILASLGMCSSYGVLVLTMFELMLGQRLFATMIASINPVGAGPDALHEICQPGFSFPNAMRVSLIETIGKPSSFPSPVLFFLSGVISYMIGSVREFEREIQTLGGDINTRTNICVGFSAALLFIMLIFRYSYGCESFGTLFISMILGCIAGLVLVQQNIAFFGRSGVNILNLPIIKPAGADGSPMYVCAPATA
jgi:hypothetical protein